MNTHQRILCLVLVAAMLSAPSLIGYVSSRTTHYRVIDVATQQGVYHGGPGRFWFTTGRALHVASDTGATLDVSAKDFHELTIEQ